MRKLSNPKPYKPTRDPVITLFRDQAYRMRSRWRKVVTGDEKKRIRDLIREKENEPSYVRLFDKIGFTLGVLNIAVCQYFLFNYPRYFWLWYSIVLPLIGFSRWYHFKKTGLQYFLFDFCYFANVLVFINMFLWPRSTTLFKVMFIFSNGPLTVAILVWRCSLVFHDYDKITSVFIHILPSILYYCGLWYGNEAVHVGNQQAQVTSLCISPMYLSPIHLSDYLYASLLYIFWQVIYYIKTEIMDRDKLDRCPELLTSLRWLSTDTKNALARAILKLLRLMRIFGSSEDYDAKSIKTKIVFMSTQFIYTLITFTITPFLYNSQAFHISYIIFIFSISVYYGASFYIDIFSKRYDHQLEGLKELLVEVEKAS
jgi:hypothetical protein